MNTPQTTYVKGSLARLVRLLLTPTWKLRIMQQLHHAEMEYDAAVNACHEVQGEGKSGFYEHNQASYWKGRRDALRVFLPNSARTDKAAWTETNWANAVVLADFARQLETELAVTRKFLADANRGAQVNAHINQSLAGQLNVARRDITELNDRLIDRQQTLMETLIENQNLRRILMMPTNKLALACSRCGNEMIN